MLSLALSNMIYLQWNTKGVIRCDLSLKEYLRAKTKFMHVIQKLLLPLFLF